MEWVELTVRYASITALVLGALLFAHLMQMEPSIAVLGVIL